MNRTTRTIVVVCIALATAAAATYVVYRAVQSMPVKAVGVAGVPVVVASRDLPAGTLLTAEHLKSVKWPADSVVPATFSSVEKIAGRGLKVALSQNEPVTEPKLAAAGTGAGLPPTIPHGMRAVSVKVDDVVSVAGFVVPGTRVDVLATVRSRSGTSQEPMTRTILSNVLVLTSGTRLDQERTKEAKPSPVVTLAVLPEDVERIALAASEGKITLSLRNPLDEGPTETTGVGVTALMRGAEPPPPAPVAKPVSRKPVVKAVVDPTPPPVIPVPDVYRVEVIRAAKTTLQEVH